MGKTKKDLLNGINNFSIEFYKKVEGFYGLSLKEGDFYSVKSKSLFGIDFKIEPLEKAYKNNNFLFTDHIFWALKICSFEDHEILRYIVLKKKDKKLESWYHCRQMIDLINTTVNGNTYKDFYYVLKDLYKEFEVSENFLKFIKAENHDKYFNRDDEVFLSERIKILSFFKENIKKIER